ncbi:MAG: ATP-binding protein [Candidatus Methanoplasma sp.]|jgi:predicted AAA+ superfamily ATPase|nr:ATP-binding protein [Candidatus Methanoplasma sp.]
MYIKRHIEGAVKKASAMFGAVLVTGPRQVGKTTMLQEITVGIKYVSLDDPLRLSSAVGESITFFKDFPPPVFVDEVQRAPSLFMVMKMIIDEKKEKGMFFLSGSQQFRMMKNVSESLAGRIGILTLLGLSLRETSGISFDRPFIPTDGYFDERSKAYRPMDQGSLWKTIQRGCLPELFSEEGMDWRMFYSSYVSAYIERDVRELVNVENELKFINFMTVIAGRTGSVLNISSVAGDIGISVPTAERWLSVLRASNIVYLLQPYHNNITSRTIKSPKLYFLDTGLAAYLTRWNTPDVLRDGAMAGAFFETFVVSEVLKSYYNAGISDPSLYYYRDKDGNEVDLLIEENGLLHPIEIKKSSDPSKGDIKAFGIVDRLGKRGPGGVICTYDSLLSLDSSNKIIPIGMI